MSPCPPAMVVPITSLNLYITAGHLHRAAENWKYIQVITAAAVFAGCPSRMESELILNFPATVLIQRTVRNLSRVPLQGSVLAVYDVPDRKQDWVNTGVTTTFSGTLNSVSLKSSAQHWCSKKDSVAKSFVTIATDVTVTQCRSTSHFMGV